MIPKRHTHTPTQVDTQLAKGAFSTVQPDGTFSHFPIAHHGIRYATLCPGTPVTRCKKRRNDNCYQDHPDRGKTSGNTLVTLD